MRWIARLTHRAPGSLPCADSADSADTAAADETDRARRHAPSMQR